MNSGCLKKILICKIDEICVSTESFILNSKIFDDLFLCAICNAIKGKGLYKISEFFLPPPLRDPRGGPNLNCKLKTFGFLDTLKVYIQSNYLSSTTLSLLPTKLAEKKLIVLCSLLFIFRFENCDSSVF